MGLSAVTKTLNNRPTKSKKAFSRKLNKWLNVQRYTADAVRPCGGPGCKTCPSFTSNPVFKSSVTGARFIMTTEEQFTCKTKRVIYLITCSTCDIQYVGLTITPLHMRMNKHRFTVNDFLNNLYIKQHYSLDGHCFSNAHIQIIDYISEQDSKKSLELLESYWIKTLNTAYPLGLNDNIRSFGNVSQGNAGNVYFIPQKVPRCRRGHGRQLKRNISSRDIITETRSLQKKFENNKMSFYYSIISYKKSFLKNILRKTTNIETPFYKVLQSFLYYKNNSVQDIKEQTSNKDRETIMIPFVSKALDNIKLKSIFLDTRIQKILPQKVHKNIPLSVRFSYNIPMGRKIFNYNRFLNKLDNQQIHDILNNNCECHNSEFLYKNHGHIITGDLSLVMNETLYKLMTKGTKYREPILMNRADLTDIVTTAIKNFVEKLSKRHDIVITEFDDWKKEVNVVFGKRLDFLEKRKPWLFKDTESALEKREVKNYLKDLQNRFIICNIDKASNNYAFICKKFFVKTLAKELGINPLTLVCHGNETYGPVMESENAIIERHCTEQWEKFKIHVTEKDKNLPRIFWNPKFHKDPYKARFISGATHCSVKHLSKLVNKGLQVLLKNFKNYCKAIYQKTGINCDWGIKNTTQFLERLHGHHGVCNAQVHDFSTLYTKLDLNDVKKAMKGMIELIFDRDYNKYINISLFKKKQFFSGKKYGNHHTFDKNTFLQAIEYILDNSFVVFGENVFRQKWGIPMGGNSSSEIADCTLGWFEFTYMKSLMDRKNRSKIKLAKILSDNKRYVDDLISMNYLNFGDLYRDIYPNGLLMERSGNHNKVVNYLDLRIELDGKGGYITKVYNKLDDFDFPVIQYTFSSGNMPQEIGHNVFFGEILRFSQLCSDKKDFIKLAKKLYEKLTMRGYQKQALIKKFRKAYGRNNVIASKYNTYDIRILEKDIFGDTHGTMSLAR